MNKVQQPYRALMSKRSPNITFTNHRHKSLHKVRYMVKGGVASRDSPPSSSPSSFKIRRLLLVDDVDVKGEIESQRVAVGRRQWFAIGSVRLEVEVLLRHEHDHVDGQQPAHNDVVVLSAGKVPVQAPLVQLAPHEVDPGVFV